MSVLNKKLFRQLLETRGQVLAVIAVVLCGTACYICLLSLHRNLELTRDTYYSQNNFADFEIQLERAPLTTLFKLEEIPGVRRVRGRIVEEVKLELDNTDESRAGRIVSVPDTPGKFLNGVVVREGRYFEPGSLNEVILSEQFAYANDLKLGQWLDVTIDGKKHELKIVGFGLSPEYVYIIRNIQEFVPSPDRFGILWVPEEFAEFAKNMQASCNSIIGSVDDPELLDGILEQADALLEPYGIFAKTERKDQISNRMISDEIKNLGAMARIMPTIFLGIAALVIMILLNRMVRNERTQIGLMKAYGHTSWAVGRHYLTYALILSVAGCLGGFVVGQFLAHQVMGIYVDYFNFPILRSRIYPDVLARAIGISISFSMVGALVAARRAARIDPAESMRPESPRMGNRILLERWTVAWSRMSFTWKMIARNIGRKKFRSGLNVFGVMISASMLIIGFYALDSMDFIIDYEFFKTQRQDMRLNLFMERGKEALYEADKIEHVRYAEPLLQYPFTMKNGWRSKDVLITGVPRNARLHRIYDLEDRPVDVGESGLVLSEKLASLMGVGVGDMLTIEPMMGRVTGEKKVRVSQLAKQYFGMSGFMNLEALSRVLGESYVMNTILLQTEPGFADAISEEMKGVPAVTTVEIKMDAVENMQKTIAQSMWVMSIMTVMFAGVIAFAIIYNVTLVSLAERERELASLRVLGFTREEVGRILYNENVLLGVVGIALGLPFGYLQCKGLVNAFDTEMYRLPFHIQPRTYLISIIATTFFIGISNFAVRHKIHTLDLIETLKERE